MNRHFILQAINEKGKSVFVDDVPNGKNCGCHCKECGGALIARQGNIKAHHFAHISGNDSIKCSQTALHLLAKEIITEEKRIPIFLNGSIIFVNVDFIEQEKNLGDIIPDLYTEYNGTPIAIEIFVSHAIDEIKLEKIQKHNLTTFEINLSNCDFETKDDVKRAIYDWRNIKLIYDQSITQYFIEQKRQFILTNGVFKPINNGIVNQCKLSAKVINGKFIRWQNASPKTCQKCFFSFETEEKHGFYCVGHLKDLTIPIWFLQTNIHENRFMNIKEVNEKLISFIVKSRNNML